MAPTGPARAERDTKAGDAAERVVRAFLSALEARDLTAAGALLSPDVRMVFPGGVGHRDLDTLVRDASERYRRVAKRIDSVEVHDGGRVVYVLGTLHGVDLNGAPFDGVRFIDRFEVEDGKIHRQDVWNDLAESGVVKQRP